MAERIDRLDEALGSGPVREFLGLYLLTKADEEEGRTNELGLEGMSVYFRLVNLLS
jgi:hypothetical protein